MRRRKWAIEDIHFTVNLLGSFGLVMMAMLVPRFGAYADFVFAYPVSLISVLLGALAAQFLQTVVLASCA